MKKKVTPKKKAKATKPKPDTKKKLRKRPIKGDSQPEPETDDFDDGSLDYRGDYGLDGF